MQIADKRLKKLLKNNSLPAKEWMDEYNFIQAIRNAGDILPEEIQEMPSQGFEQLFIPRRHKILMDLVPWRLTFIWGNKKVLIFPHEIKGMYDVSIIGEIIRRPKMNLGQILDLKELDEENGL